MTTKSTTEKPAKKLPSIRNYRELRRKMNISQSEFWSRIGVTQSGGSRYETTRRVPKPTQTVINLAYSSAKTALETLAALRGVSVDDLISGHVADNKE